MNKRELEKAILSEVEHWPGVSVEFIEGGKHLKAKLSYNGMLLSRPYAGTPGDSVFGLHACLGDMRRAMKDLGALRDRPEPSQEQDEAPYRKPNDGADKREAPRISEPATPEPTIAEKVVGAGVEGAKTLFERMSDQASANAADKAETKDRDAALAELEAAIAAIVDGIYFNLPDEIYHGVAALGSGSICDLIISPATFWRGSWLDPDRPELDEEATKAQILGKAYHCARLEPDQFEARYCRALDKADMPKGTLFSGTEMGNELAERGLKKSGSVAEQAERLADDGFPTDKLWHLALASWAAQLNGRIPLAAEYYDDILIDMERIAKVPEIAAMFTGGAAEVSVFWTDERGLRCKCRFDYLKPTYWTEFKSFANSKGKHVNQAINEAVQWNRYYVAAGYYREGAEAIRTGDLEIIGNASDDQRLLIDSIRQSMAPLACWYVFQEKAGIPNLFAREFRFHQPSQIDEALRELEESGADDDHLARARHFKEIAEGQPPISTAIYKRARWEIGIAKEAFLTYSQVYEPGEPWAPLDPIGTIDDADFHPKWLEGDY